MARLLLLKDVQRVVLRCLMLCAVMMVCADAQALRLAGEDAERHDRFLSTGERNPEFFGAGLDFSGVSLNGNAVMISPQHFVYATHVGHGASLNLMNQAGVIMNYAVGSDFGTTADGLMLEGAGGPVSGSTSDLSLGVLAEPIPAEDLVSFYEVIDAPNSWYAGREVIVFGKEGQAGRNELQGVTVVCTGNESVCANNDQTVVGHYDYDVVNGLGIDEAGGEGGDSGKPSLLVIEDRVTLLGVHFAIGGVGGSPLTSTFDSFLPFYADQLDGHMSGAGMSVSRLSVGEVVGDFTGDGSVDLADVNRLGVAIDEREIEPRYELNGDGLINEDDGTYLVESVVGKLTGDFDLDGQVNIQDLLLWAQGFGASGGYSTGDGDFSGNVNLADLILWAQHFGQVPGVAPAVVLVDSSDAISVPEPGMFGVVVLLGGLSLVRRRGRK